HLVTLSVKLFQSPPQQRNRRAEIVLKEQPLSLQAGRYRTVGLQGVGRSKLGQLRDVLLRPARVRQGQIDRKNQAQRSTQCGRVIGSFPFLDGALRIVKRLVQQPSVQQATGRPDQQKTAVMKQ